MQRDYIELQEEREKTRELTHHYIYSIYLIYVRCFIIYHHIKKLMCRHLIIKYLILYR